MVVAQGVFSSSPWACTFDTLAAQPANTSPATANNARASRVERMERMERIWGMGPGPFGSVVKTAAEATDPSARAERNLLSPIRCVNRFIGPPASGLYAKSAFGVVHA